MAEGMQHDLVSKNVVAQAVVSPPNAPLPFSGFQASELLDLVPPAAVVGIVAEDFNQLFEGVDEGRVSLGDRSEFPLECGCGEDSKRSRHDVSVVLLLFLLVFAARSFQLGQKFVRTAG